MSILQRFSPIPAATVNIAVSAASQSVQVSTGCDAVRVMNNGTATAWVNFGASGVAATVAASMPIGPGQSEIVYVRTSDGSPLFVAAIAAAATGSIYFTPGVGG